MDYIVFIGLFITFMIEVSVTQVESNACHECLRHPETCRRITGLYTVTVLSEGSYNPVVEIPTPACNINITEFKESSNYIALKTKRDQGIINSYWGLGQPGQYDGAGTTFTYVRRSSTCKGACIHADGPTNEILVVQLLYYGKNPGIAYTFTLPNSVPFTPFNGPVMKPATAGLNDPSASSRLNSSSLLHYRRHPPRQQYVNLTDVGGTGHVFEGEYYAGHHSSRSEGRPDITSALSIHNKGVSRHTDYIRYGTHTLGGRGLSYNLGGETLSSRRDEVDRSPGRHIVDRVQPYTSSNSRSNYPNIRKLPSPEYIAHPRHQQNVQPIAGRHEPLYHRTSVGGTHLDSVETDQFDITNNLNSISTEQSLGQVRNHGNNQFRWKISGFTECTHTCGGGVQRANIICVSVTSRTQVEVTSENCVDHLKPKTQTVQCNTQPCEPAWESKEWSVCSVTCGSGTQTRIVECQQRFSPFLILKVSADQCGLEKKPAVSQQCENDFCSQWKIGPWSECSKSCGGGERKRTVQCVDRLDTEISPNHCSEAAPKYFERCNTQPCTSAAHWWITEWTGECTESCEPERRIRSAVCLNKRGHIVSSSSCSKQDLPIMEELCQINKYCHGTWFSGQWSKCSAECGSGKKVRQVVCVQNSESSFRIVKNEECNLRQKPKTEEVCVNTNCNSKWYTSPWSECSATCGEGYRSREIRCVEDNKRVSDNCDISRPTSQEPCVLPICPQIKNTEKIIRPGQSRSTLYDDRKNDDSLLEDDRKIRHRQPVPNNIRTSTYRKLDKNCRDTFHNCLMVIQARLCSYSFYSKLCCESCQKV